MPQPLHQVKYGRPVLAESYVLDLMRLRATWDAALRRAPSPLEDQNGGTITGGEGQGFEPGDG